MSLGVLLLIVRPPPGSKQVTIKFNPDFGLQNPDAGQGSNHGFPFGSQGKKSITDKC